MRESRLARRDLISTLLFGTSCEVFGARPGSDALSARLSGIEKELGGRLGCAILDTRTGLRVEHRASERFPLCSTFKFLACALVLSRVDRRLERLDRRITFGASDIVANAPLTAPHVGPEGMTIEELCYAAMTVSDNTAANLLLASFGGPGALTKFARSLGDSVTRLDRWETALNEAKAGDPRDTTTPRAMVDDLQKLVLGDQLKSGSRELLTKWLVENKTGDARLRAAFPRGWRVGDKTGSGDNGTTNDIAVVWPPNRAPVLIAVYLTQASGSAEDRNAMLAKVGHAAAATLY